ncbi:MULTISPECIES: hypothetical protein [Amycolatopsis]|uniref:Uncharacterized protein n=1 Tax=Amycolatopsis dendrobii TaxID=2760662 RepID=A0A7W3ZDC3_9PSEU|nr:MULTISPECIES: hypothetical protein [Amycolatopsis]MBB1156793.1 hypothetical protein [Amycolatopsis dendrobii]UKD53500.1 hypothetical protein L3Q65_37260 [Amycolatopsis sp. FU40]
MRNQEYPEISRRKNGDRLIGIAGPLADDLYSAGTPPVWGLAKNPTPASRISEVKIGDQLQIQRLGSRWVAQDAQGVVGNLRWLPGDDGKTVVATGARIRLPLSGTFHVQRLLIDPNGVVKDIGGYVEPS